jgi:hypothetical protein
METLFQFFDEVDDFIIATALRLQRLLSPRPQERRQVPRTPDITPKPTSALGQKQASGKPV